MHCSSGGIGRHAGLKILWAAMSVRVRFPSRAPSQFLFNLQEDPHPRLPFHAYPRLDALPDATILVSPSPRIPVHPSTFQHILVHPRISQHIAVHPAQPTCVGILQHHASHLFGVPHPHHAPSLFAELKGLRSGWQSGASEPHLLTRRCFPMVRILPFRTSACRSAHRLHHCTHWFCCSAHRLHCPHIGKLFHADQGHIHAPRKSASSCATSESPLCHLPLCGPPRTRVPLPLREPMPPRGKLAAEG